MEKGAVEREITQQEQREGWGCCKGLVSWCLPAEGVKAKVLESGTQFQESMAAGLPYVNSAGKVTTRMASIVRWQATMPRTAGTDGQGRNAAILTGRPLCGRRQGSALCVYALRWKGLGRCSPVHKLLIWYVECPSAANLQTLEKRQDLFLEVWNMDSRY